MGETEQVPGSNTSAVVLAAIAGLIAVVAGVAVYDIIISADAYPLFHLLAELVGIIVGAATFMVAWNARRTIDNGYYLVIGTAYGCVALIDLLHAISYRGLALIPGFPGANLPTQLWLGGRFVQAAALLLAPALIRRRVRPELALAGWATVTAVLLAATLWWRVFPAAFVEGSGLTPFKVYSEYVISAVMFAGLILLIRRRDSFDATVLAQLAAASILGITAELAFTLYTDPFGPANYLGHLLRIAAFVLVYRALVEDAIERPFETLFRQVSRTADALRHSETRFRSTFEQATLGIMHIAPDGTIQRANQRLAGMTGRELNALESMCAEELTFPADRLSELELAEALADGRMSDYRLEKRLLRPDGTTVWVNASRSVVRDDDGQPQYYTEILEDISIRRMFEARLERQRDLSAALAAIDRAVNSTFDLDEIMRRAVAEGGGAIGAESAAVTTRESDGTWVVRHTWRFPEDILEVAFTDDDLPHAVEAARAHAPVAIMHAYDDPRVNTSVTRRFGIRSVLVIPLESRGDQLGTLYFNYHSDEHSFDEDEVDFALQLSAALAVAIQNSKLYLAERDTVDTLQTALLRIDTDLPGIRVATAYHSATDLTRIGGDFFDVFSLGDGRIAFVVGDVAGKGLPAAAVTATAKSTLRAFGYEWPDPSRVMTAANQVLLRQLDEGRFITAVFGMLDLGTGETRIVCAGHPAPLVCDAHGCRSESVERNPPLAVFDELIYDEYHTTMYPGDRMVLFSDGLIDARHGADFLGEEGVRDLIDQHGDADPETLANRLLEAARSHSDGTPPDDIAIVAFRYLGPPETHAGRVR